jgi:hypothetical protein
MFVPRSGALKGRTMSDQILNTLPSSGCENRRVLARVWLSFV